ncbi:MAG: peptidoglycan recognition protein family protein, partial [Planctomycetota bacterium]
GMVLAGLLMDGHKVSKQKVFARAIVWAFLFALSGCISNDEPLPEIVGVYPVNSEVLPPDPPPPPVRPRVSEDVPREWVPPSRLERGWKAIVVHHSGTETGNAAIFDKSHRKRYWAGIGYDFVIGNGSNSGDGQVEVTFRWRQQKTGAHCKTPNNWANEKGVGICLVGNFDDRAPTSRQMKSLVKLVRFLQKRYQIPKSRIYSHKNTPGARVTDCPGRHFSMARLKSMLGS